MHYALIFSAFLLVLSLDYFDANQVLSSYKYYHGGKRTALTTLGYLTPWNRLGYNVSLEASEKLDMVSPVWYNVKPLENDYVLEGHPEREWLSAIKTRVVPRFNLLEFQRNHFIELIQNASMQQKMIDLIVKECKSMKYQGLVFESPVNVYLGDLFNKIRQSNLLIIATLHPMPSTDIRDLANSVDGISLMTYDYSRTNGPNAPIEWMRKTVLEMFPDRKSRSKVLLGLNFYGNEYSKSQSRTIINREYLDLLKNLSCEWKKEYMEHYCYYYKDSQQYSVWYPTLQSINARLELTQELGVGISIWEIGQGLEYFVF